MPLKMDYGNEVDLSNNNITPLWKRRPTNTGSRDLTIKPRPLSYQIGGVHTTDFPVEDKCAFTLTQPAEKIVATPAGSTMVLKHILNKPSRKTRVVRSISIGHSSNGRLSLSKYKQEDKQCAENKMNYNTGPTRMPNGASVCVDGNASCADSKNLSSPHTVLSQRDQIVFGNSASSPNHIQTACGTSPQSLSVTPQGHRQDTGASSPSLRASSRSSSSSIMSLSSTPSTLSDPPTPRTPSPDDGVSDRKSSSVSEGKQSPSVLLSTQSPAALKMGTQQLIPQGLASDTRPVKTGQGKGSGGLLDPGQRALKARSMVEAGSFFSTSTEPEEEAEGEDSPGLLRRGLRSTSYRRAVVSGVDLDVSPTELKPKRFSQPVLKGVAEDRERPSSPGKIKVWRSLSLSVIDIDSEFYCVKQVSTYARPALENSRCAVQITHQSQPLT